MGMHDLLYFAGATFAQASLEHTDLEHADSTNKRAKQDQTPALEAPANNRFELRIASPQGEPIKLMNQLSAEAHCSYAELAPSDVYLVPAMAGEPQRTLASNSTLIKLLGELDLSSCLLGSNSNGGFFLAEAGLLDQKRATSFWADADYFAERYPRVKLERDERLVRDGNIISDSGGSSWFDLGLYLVELFCDHATAVAAAKYFMVDLARSAQLSFAPAFGEQQHQDQSVRAVQDWLAKHYGEAIVLSEVAERFGLSSRSLVRRFKLATGLTPVNYLQELRLDAASRLLVQTRRSVEDITQAVGYQDVSSFIRLFKRRTQYSPSSYRARFRNA